jgi:protein O-mannosyl-transferase
VLLILLVVLLAGLIYAGMTSAPFLYDDMVYVRDNTLIRDFGNFFTLWGKPYPPSLPEAGLYRPVTTLSYLLDYQVWGGTKAGGFHLTNILLNCAAAALAFLTARCVGLSPLAALGTGLLFAAHPIHSEAVCWVVGRAEILAAIFVFLGVLCWVRWRQGGHWLWLVAAAACYFLGLGSKETAAPLPGVLFLGDWLGLWTPGSAGGKRTVIRNPFSLQNLYPYAAFVAVLGFYLILRENAIGSLTMIVGASGSVGHSRWERITDALALFYSFFRYSLVALPGELAVHHGPGWLTGLGSFKYLGGVALLMGLPALIFALRKRAPRVCFWCGWFFVFILPFSNLVTGVGTGLNERLLYIASLFSCALGGMLLAWVVARTRSWRRWAAIATAAIVVLGMGAGTVIRSRDWQDEERFWRVEIDRSNSQKPLVSLGMILWNRGVREKNEALRDEGDELLRKSFEKNPPTMKLMTRDQLILLRNLAIHASERGHNEEAVVYFRQLDELTKAHTTFRSGVSPEIWALYGLALEATKRSDEALGVFERVAAQRKDWGLPLVNIGNILVGKGQQLQAIEYYRRAVAIDPKYHPGYVNLGLALNSANRQEEARKVLGDMERAVPDGNDKYFAAAVLAKALGDKPRAAQWYRRALAARPDWPEARKGLQEVE